MAVDYNQIMAGIERQRQENEAEKRRQLEAQQAQIQTSAQPTQPVQTAQQTADPNQQALQAAQYVRTAHPEYSQEQVAQDAQSLLGTPEYQQNMKAGTLPSLQQTTQPTQPIQPQDTATQPVQQPQPTGGNDYAAQAKSIGLAWSPEDADIATQYKNYLKRTTGQEGKISEIRDQLNDPTYAQQVKGYLDNDTELNDLASRLNTYHAQKNGLNQTPEQAAYTTSILRMQIAQDPNLYKNAEAIMSGAYGADSVAGSGKVSRGGRRRKGGRKGRKAKALQEEAVQEEEKLTASDLFGDDTESSDQDESAANEAYRNKLVQADLKDAHDNYFANLAKLHKGDSVQDRYVNALVNDSLSNNKLNLDSDTDINDVINRKRKLNLSDNSVSINDIIAGKGKKKLNIDTASGNSVKKDAVSGSSVLNMTDDEKLAYYADPNRKLTKDERKDARALMAKYNRSIYDRRAQDPETKRRIQQINAIGNKSNPITSFMGGALEKPSKLAYAISDAITKGAKSLPFLNDDQKAKIDDVRTDIAENKAAVNDNLKGTQNQHPILYGGGKLAENVAEQAAVGGAMEGTKLAGALSSKLGDFGANIAMGTMADAVTDTLPTEIENASNGMGGKDIAVDAAKNLGTNAAWNVGGELLGRGIKKLANLGKKKDVVEDAVETAQDAVKPTEKAIAENVAEQGENVVNDVVKSTENNAIPSLKKSDADFENFIKNYDPNAAKEAAKTVPSPRDYYKQVVNDAVDNAVDKEAVNTLKDSVKDTRKLTEDELIPVAQNLQKRYQKIKDKIPEAEKAQFEKGIEQKFDDIFAKQQKYTLDDMDSYIKGYEDKVNPLVKTKYGEFRQSDLGERFENVAQNGLDYVAKKRVNPSPIKSEITQESYAKVLSNVTQIKNGIDDVAKKVDFTDKPLAAKKFEELKASYNFLQEAVTSDDMAYISQAKKAVESSRKSFVNAMKKAGDTSYGDLGKPKFGRIIDSVDKSILDNKNAVKGALPADTDGLIKVDESDLPEHLRGTTGFDYAKGVDLSDKADAIQKAGQSRSGAINGTNAPLKITSTTNIGLGYPANNQTVTSAATNVNQNLPSLNPPNPTNATGSQNVKSLLPLNLQMFAEKAKQYGKDIEAMTDGADKESLRKAYKEYQVAMQSAIDGGDRKAAKDAFERLEGSLSAVKERGYAKSIRTKTDLPDEVKQAFIDEPEVYKQLSNKDTKAKAESIFNSGSLEEVSTKYRDLLDKRDPSAVPLSDMINRELISQGKTDEAVQNIRELAEKMTKAGQFNQAALINLMHDDPMTALKYAQKDIDKLNKEGLAKFGKKWKDFELTQDEIKAFGDIKAGDSDAIKKMLDKVGQRIGREYPTTMTEKLLEARKISMLLNTRTLSRNFGANVSTLGMRSVADRVEAVGQHVAKLINPDFTMTQSLKGSTGKARSIANEVYASDAVQELLKGSPGKYSSELKNGIAENKQMFKNSFLSDAVDKGLKKVFGKGSTDLNKALSGKEGITSGMETLRNLTYKALDVGDTPFVKENFISRLGSYINAQGIKSVDEVPDEAIQIAYEEAMKATYKDNSWAVGMVSGVKKAIGKVPYVGKPISDAIIPFVQAPANIGARMVDYSPIRGTKGIVDIVKGAKSADEAVVKRGIEELSKGVTGTTAVLAGIALHNAGIITGSYSKDKDQAQFQKQNGFREYAIKVGDKYFTYDWMQPAAQPLIVGSIIADAIQKSDEYDSDLLNYVGADGDDKKVKTAKAVAGIAKESAKASINSWFNASPMQSLSEILSGGYGGDTNIAENLWKVGVENAAGSFIPAQLNATAKSIDTVQRNTRDYSSNTASFVNAQKAKIPILSENLPIKYDSWGRPMKYGDTKAEAAAAKFIIPGDYSADKSDDVDKEVNRLFDTTKDVSVFPPVLQKKDAKINDKTLNNKEMSDYQHDFGALNRELVENTVNTSDYKNLSEEDKVKTIKSLYDFSKARNANKFGKDFSSSDAKMNEVYEKEGSKGVINRIVGKMEAESLGLEANDYTLDAYNKKGLPGLKDYQKANTLYANYKKALGNEAPKNLSKDAYQIFDEGGSDLLKTALMNDYNKTASLSRFAQAKGEIPSLKYSKYVKQMQVLDSNHNGKLTWQEVRSVANSMSKEDGERVIKGFYNKPDRFKYVDGKWQFTDENGKVKLK